MEKILDLNMFTIVMTGGTSGFGEFTVKRLIQSPNTRILLGARRSGPPGTETLPLDLTKLDHVRSFVSDVSEKLGKNKIDALVLNAGVTLPNDNTRTTDGFETTFAVNHLAHYLMLRLLLPKLAHGAKIVLTTSGTHDPTERTIIPPPRHADAKLLAHPELDPNHDQKPGIAAGRAYSSSKLCTILTARALVMLPEVRGHQFTVIAYDPGPTPGTGLTRNTHLAVRGIWYLLGTPILQPFLPNMNSRSKAGSTLADLALGRTLTPEGKIYAALRKGRINWLEPSALARRDDLMNLLWRDSSELVGLPE